MTSLRWVAAGILAAVVTAGIGFAAGWWIFGPDRNVDGRANEAGSGDREILYWVAPMDPNFRRDKPGKSPMGMDLVPVYADADAPAQGPPALTIDPAVVNNIGVKTARVQRTDLARTIETVARVVPNDYRLGHVHVRTEGWIEYLNVHTEGDRVERGEVLFRFYAPALVSAQREYIQALAEGRPPVIAAAAERLLALGLQPQQVDELEQSRKVERLVDVRSPLDGYVIELNVRHGMHVKPELMIMSIADLSSVWVEVDVFEQQIGWVETGQPAEMRLPFDPGRVWRGEVDYVYPTIRPETRSARVRLVFDNSDLALKPNMYAGVDLAVAPRRGVLAVPARAVIRTGDRDRVILALGEGRFRPAEVVTGIETGGRVEIVKGVAEGERVVVSAQFLIDSEASMDASLMRMLEQAPGGMDHDGGDS